MSRQYDDSCLYLPSELPEEDYAYEDNVEYRRMKGYKDYFVSSDGDIISFRRREPRILATWPNQYGHRMTRIMIGGHKNDILVHRAVAEAFIPNPEGHDVVRHLDDDPENNHYKNLAWGTHKDNTEDSRKHGRMFMKKVYCYEEDSIYNSCADAADAFGVTRGEITQCCKGKIGTVRGHHLCYLNELEEKKRNPNWLKERSPYKKTIAISPSGKRMIFSSRKEASEAIGIPNCGISSVLSGHLKHTHGWRFEEG